METDRPGLVIGAEILKAYLFGKNVVPNTKQMDYFTSQVACQLTAVPPQIRLGPSTVPGNRFGVYSTVWIAQGTEMGPFLGVIVPTSKVDVTKCNEMLWEVFTDSGQISHFIDGSGLGPGLQSWINLVGTARSESEQNLEVIQINHDIYYKAIKPIPPDTELLVWYSNDASLYLGIPCIETNLQRPTTATGDYRQMREQSTEPVAPPTDARLKCVICRRGFNSRSNLRSHMRIHTLEKPFLCKYCHRSFSQSSTLRNHTRLHTGEKPYRCTICQSAYSQLAGLRAHQKSARHRPHKSQENDKNLIISV